MVRHLTFCARRSASRASVDEKSLNSCSSVASRYEVTSYNLIAWNRSLSAGDCKLQAGYRYCIQQTGSTSKN